MVLGIREEKREICTNVAACVNNIYYVYGTLISKRIGDEKLLEVFSK
jgi:hypothetical protein